MNIILLIAGVFFILAGIFFKKNVPSKKYGLVGIISGVLIMFFYFIYLLLDVKPAIILQIVIILCVLSVINSATTVQQNKSISENPTDRQYYIFKWCPFSFYFLPIMFLFVFTARFPPVKIDNGIIRMGGAFGGKFAISEIKTVDTVSFYPKVKFMLGGGGSFNFREGNFKLQDEEKTAKLNVWKNNPPYIAIRMNDNRLFLLNFKKPDKTVEFYNQLKTELNNP